ncbi:hypothetical protein BD779DRAFT_1614547 [Infundibulicybe gibba]|nr:hypothetical protein BD779DRAFT_1614547 [Infundibulicybe gibba]
MTSVELGESQVGVGEGDLLQLDSAGGVHQAENWLDANYPGDDPENTAEGIDVDAFDQPTKCRRRDAPFLAWMSEQDTFVSEFLRLEGRGDARGQDGCPECGKADSGPLFRCDECLDLRLLCQQCTVSRHKALPLHRIMEWNGKHFTASSLKSLGVSIQLGHLFGRECPNPAAAFNNDFVIIHTNGIHQVTLKFCNCQVSLLPYVQLLRARLFPATTIAPRTAATFSVLRTFQITSFMSKISGYEYYHALSRITNNVGVPPPDRYSTFMRMVREWRQIKLMKRMGRGHDASGVAGTAEGSCAVICPACPHPNKNLPEDWRSVPPEKAWLYTLFVGIDANFRLKRLNISSNERDPGLNKGYSYIVEETQFKEFLKQYDHTPQEPSTCNNHDAIKSASMRGGRGIASSGIGTIECSRHDMKRPCSVGDLQKGERYVNMDYFFLSSLRQNTPERLVVSYDIACQWSLKLRARSSSYPADLSIDSHQLTYVIPKWHLAAHRLPCHANYSFYYTPWVGRTDGEAPERGWAAANGLATSTKEMGPGSRSDTLDDHFGDYNWRKVVTLASSLLRKVEEAKKERSEHVNDFLELSASIAAEHPEELEQWTTMVQAWEQDRSNPNPFASSTQQISESAVRLQLANEEAEALTLGALHFIHDEITPSVFLTQGIEIEDQHRHPTDLQQAKLQERRNRLSRRIEAWYEIQQLYIPSAPKVRMQYESTNSPPESWNLLLPSELLKHPGISFDACFINFEWRLRWAQAFSALNDLRRHLLLRSQLSRSKDKHVRGQSALTRSQRLIQHVQAKINRDAQKYQIIHDRLKALAPMLQPEPGNWTQQLPVLVAADIHGLNVGDEGSTEGRRTLSWIWKAQGPGHLGEGELMSDALRLEWCKARARAHRWQEECLLLQEEMRRTLAFFQSEIEKWGMIIAGLPSTDATEGLKAYACRQADIRRGLLTRCQDRWRDSDTNLMTGDGAPQEGVMKVEYQRTLEKK